MSRVNRRPKKRTSGYTIHDVFLLKWGHDFAFGDGIGGDLEDIAAAWEIFRDEILVDWLHETPRHGSGGPGTRPWAWWKFDAPEFRRRPNGVHPFDNPERQAVIVEREKAYPDFRRQAMKTYFGVPSCLCCPDDFQAEYETEREYLTRLNFLMECEK